MRVAVLGSGAREHALAARFARECGEQQVWVSPGGDRVPGSFRVADGELPAALRARGVELVVVGPEALLAAGLADRLREAGFLVLGPSRADSRLETSKRYGAAFAARHGVARPRCVSVRGVRAAADAARAELRRGGVVVKFDGLAAGKGVHVCGGEAELRAALSELERQFGADAALLVEQRLYGRELSLTAVVAGGQARLFAPVEDHKPLLDGDRGPMTGGMGVVYPIPADSPALRQQLCARIVEPTLRGLRAEHPEYRGVLYMGCLLTAEGPTLLEYNVRFGDPEAQVLASSVAGSFTELCASAARGEGSAGWLAMSAPACVAVVLAAPGYPAAPERGVPVALSVGADIDVYDAGVARTAEGLRTAGGRVLTLVARGDSVAAARATIYAALPERMGLHYRRDIGARP